MQALGMKQIEKEVVTLIFVHQVADREIHGVISSEGGAYPLEGATMTCESQGARSLIWAHEPEIETEREFRASFERDDGATRGDRVSGREGGAHTGAARHAVESAE
jgi:hypothetical protein